MRFFCECLRGCRTQSEIKQLAEQRSAGISLARFCDQMHINRTSFYYTPRPESTENIEIMRIMDEYHYEHPTVGKIGFTDYLKSIGYHVNVKRVQRLMKVMDITAIYPRRSLTHQGAPKYIHPYLLRNLNITQLNQVWSIDITYIPMENGFMYLYAIIDVYSRYIVGWLLSNSLSASNC